jgi:hypothetical protein
MVFGEMALRRFDKARFGIQSKKIGSLTAGLVAPPGVFERESEISPELGRGGIPGDDIREQPDRVGEVPRLMRRPPATLASYRQKRYSRQ